VRRRQLIGSLAALGVAGVQSRAGAQQPERIRRIGVLYGTTADDAPARARHEAFLEAFQKLGWVDGGNARIDVRWGEGRPERLEQQAAELVKLSPDAILVSGQAASQLLKATQKVPIVFVIAIDPIGAGVVERLSRPGGNVTGFMQFDYSLCGKWPELLKQMAPEIKRVGVLRDLTVTEDIGQFAVIQSVASLVGVEVSPVSLREVEAAIAAFAGSPSSGLIVTSGALAVANRGLIVSLAAKHKLPTVYSNRAWPEIGGLISYGADFFEQYRGAAGYIDRILKGEKPADMPVQAPVKYELVINLKTARALGLTVPQTLLARADEVIE
jgi:putative ABC transport system substrate-binding protein